MVRWWLSVAIAAAVGLVGEAQAAEQTGVPLTWKVVGGGAGDLKRVARVPHAEVTWTRHSSGARYLAVTYDDGTLCSTVGLADAPAITFACGSAAGYYRLGQAIGELPALDWIANEKTRAVGAK